MASTADATQSMPSTGNRRTIDPWSSASTVAGQDKTPTFAFGVAVDADERLFSRSRQPSKRAIAARAAADRVARNCARSLRLVRHSGKLRLALCTVAAGLVMAALASLFGGKSAFDVPMPLHDVPHLVAEKETSSDLDLRPNSAELERKKTQQDEVSSEHIASTDPYENFASTPLSIVVLFHDEYDSFTPVLNSWIDKGLTDYAQEIIFFLNGAYSDAKFRQRMPAVGTRIPEEKVRVFPQRKDLAIGLAIKVMVELASSEFVLLLEKDWELIEPRSVMESRLRDSKILLGSNKAQLVRHRHRVNPGVPIHALIMHQGREESIMRQQPNMLCFVHHWQKDPTVLYPGAGIMKRCGGAENHLDEEDVFCTPAKYCQWTNNPCVFRKRWFLDEVGNEFQRQYDIELEKEGPSSPFLDFEYYTNWRDNAWNSRNITVAVGSGLFSHAESEHKHFNTFWYAHFRLTSDLEEVRNFYLKNETQFKKLGGVHWDPNYPRPGSMMERYPVEFVRTHHVPQMFTGSISDQREMIAKIFDPYFEMYRARYDSSTGKVIGSGNANRAVPWRNLITNLHFETERAMMVAPPEMPHEMSITLVTSLLDIDRHTVDRGFDMYLAATQEWLTHEYPKVVYTTEAVAEKLLVGMTNKTKESTKFVFTSRDELRTKWIGPDNYDKIQEIRKDATWRGQATWLAESPQASLADYNALVMSKLYMTRHASRSNFWNTSHFVYIDAKHNCRNPKAVTPRSDHIFRAHMFDKFLLTYFDYVPANEVHGFEYRAFNEWLNIADKTPVMVKVGRGGVFGGSAFILEAITAMYDVALTATLRSGLMGTEENIFSILMYQVPQYIDSFSNDWACREVLNGDHKCSKSNPHYNCGIFVWAAEDAPSAS
jgi:hypothetical protein